MTSPQFEFSVLCGRPANLELKYQKLNGNCIVCMVLCHGKVRCCLLETLDDSSVLNEQICGARQAAGLYRVLLDKLEDRSGLVILF